MLWLAKIILLSQCKLSCGFYIVIIISHYYWFKDRVLMQTEQIIAAKFKQVSPFLNERALRIWAATEAAALSRGGVALLAKITGLSRPTIYTGLQEIKEDGLEEIKEENLKTEPSAVTRARKEGGGRKKTTDHNEALINALSDLIDPCTRGDPMNPLRWTCKSTLKIAEELNKMGHKVSQRTVYNLLDEMHYSMQSNRKSKEAANHPDRDAQFVHISKKVKEFQGRCQPVISVDTKKKELIGEFKNNGKEWGKCGEPTQVNVHDFPDKKLGKVAPYGVYDLTENKGWVSVGISADTAEFAVSSIRNWWKEMGCKVYPHANELLITADGGGSNGYRVGLWKKKLRELADELRLEINVCHFPPGTSKWNKIEHRMFCHITQNWRGRPLTSQEVVVNLIGNTTTKNGLTIQAKLDENIYEKGIKISKKELEDLNIIADSFHGEWNYKFTPKEK
jgi:transposase